MKSHTRISRIAICIALCAAVSAPVSQTAYGKKALIKGAALLFSVIGKKVVTKKGPGIIAAVIAGAGSAKALENILDEGEGIYSLSIDFDAETWTLKRADLFSRADLIAVVHVEGQGVYIIPEKSVNYRGGKLIWTIKMPTIPKGRDISVFIYDDDTLFNKAWNTIFSDPVTIKLESIKISDVVTLETDIGGHFDLNFDDFVLNPNDQLGNYSTTCPRFYFGDDWETMGEVFVGDERLGEIRFAQVEKH